METITPEEGPKRSPIIHRPDDNPELLERLVRKREEYRQRIAKYGEFKHPEQILVLSVGIGDDGALDSMLKFQLLNEVLESETGEVATFDFTRRVIEEDPVFAKVRQMDPRMLGECLNAACEVIDAYCQGAAGTLRGGTGLH